MNEEFLMRRRMKYLISKIREFQTLKNVGGLNYDEEKELERLVEELREIRQWFLTPESHE